MTKEVMKQALEAFEAIMMVRDINSATTIAKNARYGLREALNQDQSEQLARLGWQEIYCPICGGGARAFPKQKQGEPVAWVDLLKDAQQIVKDKFLYKRFIDGTPLANDIPCWMADFAQKYTKPQTKEWVGLTDKEIFEIWEKAMFINNGKHAVLNNQPFVHFARAIEAKLKEKNA